MENNTTIPINFVKSDFAQINAGDYLSEVQYYEVVEKSRDSIKVRNERGFTFYITNSIVEEGMYTANQFNESSIVKVTRTKLIEIFAGVKETVFTVNFHKQPKSEDINAAIEAANKGRILPIAEMKKLIKNAFKGEERTLVGYLVSTETGFGRSKVIDLQEKDESNRYKQVDHRTLNYLIWRGVKYVVG